MKPNQLSTSSYCLNNYISLSSPSFILPSFSLPSLYDCYKPSTSSFRFNPKLINFMPFCLFIFICRSTILAALSQSKFSITIEIRTEHNSARVESCFDPRHWFMNIVLLLLLFLLLNT